MHAFDLILLSLALSADAFAASVTNGLLVHPPYGKIRLYTAICFGAFQAAMPVAGYWAGQSVAAFVALYSHWIAFALLSVLGCKTITMAFLQKRSHETHKSPTPWSILTQAVATSIDALSAGIGFAIIGESIFPEALCIGLITFACSFMGFTLGRRFGEKLADGVMLVGGVLLILIGVHLVVSHR